MRRNFSRTAGMAHEGIVGMMMTLLVLTGFVAVGIAVMLATAKALFGQLPGNRSATQTQVEPRFTRHAA
jgi:hypothetical protein